MAPPPQPLTAIGKYRLVRVLGEGAMGVVYHGHDEQLDRHVAIKVIRQEVSGGAQASQAAARFRNEAVAAARLMHPGIVAVYDYGVEPDGTAFIVMEYAPGEDLDVWGKRYAPLALPYVHGVMAQLLDALYYAHMAGVIHRDIKPSNVRVGPDGRIKITDFGIARIADATKLTQTGAALGTPTHMAPEQYMGTGVDHRADLFSAGVVFYELLTGHKPFEGQQVAEVAYKICHVPAPPPSQLNPRLTKQIDHCVARSLAKQKDQRFTTAHEMAYAIGLALTAASPSASQSVSTRETVVAPPPSAAELDRVTQLLTSYCGPIARILVKRAAEQASDYRALCFAVATNVNERDRARFLHDLGVR